MLEQTQRIDQERAVLQKHADFFTGIEPKGYVGVLTRHRMDVVTSIYPQAITGMNLIYHHMVEDSLDLTSEEGFLVRYLQNQYLEGNLISDEQVDNLIKAVQTGHYSKQYDAYVRYRRRMNSGPGVQTQQNKKEEFEAYRPIRTEGDVLYNKRVYLARVLAMTPLLRSLYGEVDYQRALVAESIINAPFLDTVVAGGQVDAAADKRHQAFFEDVTAFAHDFKPEERFAAFDELTSQFAANWGEETRVAKVNGFDRPFIEQVYDFAGKFLDGKLDLNELYPLYQQTIVRRGKLFKATAVRTNSGTHLSLEPLEPTDISFDDIAGYDEQKSFYQNVLAKTAANDPIMGDIRMVLAAGEPGLGKSLGVSAFLNALPDNARGMVAKLNGLSTDEYQLLARLAKMHSELEIFAVLEDIDALAGDRLSNRSTRDFLELDSVYEDTVPHNFHLVATTNRPYVIDSAVIRPGRTAKILIYEAPDEDDRRSIAALHAQKNGIALSDDTLNTIVSKTDRFSPDEVRHIVWSIRFEGLETPTEEDIDRFVKEIATKHKA